MPAEEAPREAEPLEGAHGEASPMEEVSGEASPLEGASGEATPTEEVLTEATPRREGRVSESRTESSRDRRPEPVENVVERQIGGKIFKLGRLLSQEEQDEVATVISRHLSRALSAQDSLTRPSLLRRLSEHFLRGRGLPGYFFHGRGLPGYHFHGRGLPMCSF